jgi:hypothetical protein
MSVSMQSRRPRRKNIFQKTPIESIDSIAIQAHLPTPALVVDREK